MARSESAYSGSSGTRSSRRRGAKKGWRSTLMKYKFATFDMLVAIQKADGHQTPPIVIYTIWLFEFCQYLAFCFLHINWGPYGNTFGSAIAWSQIDDRAAAVAPYSVLQVLELAALALVFILVVLTLYVVRSFISKDFKAGVTPLRVLRTLAGALQTLLYVPVLSALIATLPCRDNMTIECWAGEHMGYGIASLIGVTVFITFATVFCLAHFEPNPMSPDIRASPLPMSELQELASKSVLIILYNLTHAVPVIRAVVALIVFLVMMVCHFFFLPFYKKRGNLVRSVSFSVLFVSAAVSVGVAATDQTNSNIAFYIWIGLVPVSVFFSSWLFFYRWQWATSRERLVEAIKAARTEDPENFPKTLMKKLHVFSVSGVTLILRFVWEQPTPENLEIVDTVYKAAMEVFTPPHFLAAYLLQQYGQFLKICFKDFTISMLYFKKAAELNPWILFQFVIYQSERDRKDKAMEAERGFGGKLDAVDRVEYRQLTKRATLYHRETGQQISNFWKAVALDKTNAVALTTVTNRMERAERSAQRYYKQLMNRFSHIPKVLDSYSKFLELTAQLEEAETIKRQMDDLLEEMEEEKAQKVEKGGGRAPFVMSENDYAGSVVSGGRGRASSVAHQSVASDLPVPIFRTPREKRLHRQYHKIVSSYQRHASKQLSLRIAVLCFVLFAVELSRMLGIELVSQQTEFYVSQVRQAGNCSLFTTKILTNARNMQLAAASNDSAKYEFRRGVVSLMSDSVQQIILTLYFKSDLIMQEHFTTKITSVDYYKGLTPYPWSRIDQESPVELALEMSRHAKSIVAKDMPFFQEIGQYTIMFEDGSLLNITLPTHYTNPDWRYIIDNGLRAAGAFDNLTHILADANDTGIKRTYAVAGVVYGLAVIILALIAVLIFRPAVRRAARQRQLSIEAFLEIPKDIAMDMYRKTRFQSAMSAKFSQNDEEMRRESENEKSDSSDDDDDEDEILEVTHSSSSILGARATTFQKITGYYLFALGTVLALYTISVVGGIVLNVLMAYTGRRCERAAQTPFVIEGARFLATEAIVQDPSFQAALRNVTISSLLLEDAEIFDRYRNGLYYGESDLGLPERRMDSYERDFFYSPRLLNNTVSLDELSAQVIEDLSYIGSVQVSSLNFTMPQYIRIQSNILLVESEFSSYADYLDSTFSTQQGRLSLFSSKIMFPIFLLWIIRLYFSSFRRVLRKIGDENQRTVRLLLMLPADYVGRIESVRELFHIENWDDQIGGLKKQESPGRDTNGAGPEPADVEQGRFEEDEEYCGDNNGSEVESEQDMSESMAELQNPVLPEARQVSVLDLNEEKFSIAQPLRASRRSCK
ncbi:hypothetical protein HK104_004603 [Borealophlyctis nickersoniae]|nr:hypothetical protein HK104_004603 [Borealophlyctis nickersoniae]